MLRVTRVSRVSAYSAFLKDQKQLNSAAMTKKYAALSEDQKRTYAVKAAETMPRLTTPRALYGKVTGKADFSALSPAERRGWAAKALVLVRKAVARTPRVTTRQIFAAEQGPFDSLHHFSSGYLAADRAALKVKAVHATKQLKKGYARFLSEHLRGQKRTGSPGAAMIRAAAAWKRLSPMQKASYYQFDPDANKLRDESTKGRRVSWYKRRLVATDRKAADKRAKQKAADAQARAKRAAALVEAMKRAAIAARRRVRAGERKNDPVVLARPGAFWVRTDPFRFAAAKADHAATVRAKANAAATAAVAQVRANARAAAERERLAEKERKAAAKQRCAGAKAVPKEGAAAAAAKADSGVANGGGTVRRVANEVGGMRGVVKSSPAAAGRGSAVVAPSAAGAPRAADGATKGAADGARSPTPPAAVRGWGRGGVARAAGMTTLAAGRHTVDETAAPAAAAVVVVRPPPPPDTSTPHVLSVSNMMAKLVLQDELRTKQDRRGHGRSDVDPAQ